MRHRPLVTTFLVIVLVLAAQRGAAGQGSGNSPGLAVCDTPPRDLSEVQALGADPILEPVLPPATMPDGERPDAETEAVVLETIAAYQACAQAGDSGRQLGFFTDDLVRGLAGLAGAQGVELTEETIPLVVAQFSVGVRAVRHLRVVDAGRVAMVVVLDPQGLAYIELVEDGDRWRFAVIAAFEGSGEGERGILGATYTDPDLAFGIEWDAAWQRIPSEGAPLIGDLVLDNGAGVVSFRWSLLGVENLTPVTTLGQCVGPPSPYAFTDGTVDPQSIAVANDAAGRPLRGESEVSAFGVYDLGYYPAGDFLPLVGAAGSQPVPYRLLLDCRVLPGSDSFLQIAHLVPAGDYDAQEEARTALLDGVEI